MHCSARSDDSTFLHRYHRYLSEGTYIFAWDRATLIFLALLSNDATRHGSNARWPVDAITADMVLAARAGSCPPSLFGVQAAAARGALDHARRRPVSLRAAWRLRAERGAGAGGGQGRGAGVGRLRGTRNAPRLVGQAPSRAGVTCGCPSRAGCPAMGFNRCKLTLDQSLCHDVSSLAMCACLAVSVFPGLSILVPRLAPRVTLAVRADASWDVIYLSIYLMMSWQQLHQPCLAPASPPPLFLPVAGRV